MDNMAFQKAQPIRVLGQSGDYPVYIQSYFDSLPKDLKTPFCTILIVCAQSISDGYLAQVCEWFGSDVTIDTMLVEDGDANKNLAAAEAIWTHLITKGHQRDTLLVALGGGVIGDLVGFAASCYMRGVAWLNIPTTLLAQVDASVGGKTAVNHPLGKNLIGSFYAPVGVVCSLHFLKTLSDEDYTAGLAEVLKYGLILDADFFNWLEQNKEAIKHRNEDILAEVVYRCLELKAQVVNEDFKDRAHRAVLNFGHTLGHALEKVHNYEIRHGDAVSIGLLFAIHCSEAFGLDSSLWKRVEVWLRDVGLPTKLSKAISVEDILAAMLRDKKNQSQQAVRLVLLKALGEAYLSEELEGTQIRHMLERFRAKF